MKKLVAAAAMFLASLVGATALHGGHRSHQDEAVEPDKEAVERAHAEKAQSIAALTVQVVISRHQGTKQISSVPYTLSVSSNDAPSLFRMRTRVPVVSQLFDSPDSEIEGREKLRGVTYEEVGVSIDCQARSLPDGRYRLQISLEDSSVHSGKIGEEKMDVVPAWPSFRVFRSNQIVLLGNGQSTQYVAATDKFTGEVIKVEVSLAVADKKR